MANGEVHWILTNPVEAFFIVLYITTMRAFLWSLFALYISSQLCEATRVALAGLRKSRVLDDLVTDAPSPATVESPTEDAGDEGVTPAPVDDGAVGIATPSPVDDVQVTTPAPVDDGQVTPSPVDDVQVTTPSPVDDTVATPVPEGGVTSEPVPVPGGVIATPEPVPGGEIETPAPVPNVVFTPAPTITTIFFFFFKRLTTEVSPSSNDWSLSNL